MVKFIGISNFKLQWVKYQQAKRNGMNVFLFTEQEWVKINVKVFKTTNDKKLKWLQFRINQCILTTVTFLKKY